MVKRMVPTSVSLTKTLRNVLDYLSEASNLTISEVLRLSLRKLKDTVDNSSIIRINRVPREREAMVTMKVYRRDLEIMDELASYLMMSRSEVARMALIFLVLTNEKNILLRKWHEVFYPYYGNVYKIHVRRFVV